MAMVYHDSDSDDLRDGGVVTLMTLGDDDVSDVSDCDLSGVWLMASTIAVCDK